MTWNRRHFLALAKRRRQDGRLSYPWMSVLAFRCSHPAGLARLRAVIEDVEAVYWNRVVGRGGRLIAQIDETVLRFEDPEGRPSG